MRLKAQRAIYLLMPGFIIEISKVIGSGRNIVTPRQVLSD